MINESKFDLNGRFSRQVPLLGEDSGEILGEKTVLLCGLGGVGGHVLEALARAGVGRFILVDCDVFDVSNLNRQLLCTVDNLGTDKVLAGERRIKEINPSAEVKALKIFLDGEKIPALLSENRINCIVDAIDNVSAKVALAKHAEDLGIPIIASMGTGNKLDPSGFICADIYETSVCPLAKAMRKLLKEAGVKGLKVVYSKEPPVQAKDGDGNFLLGSVSFVPGAAGLVIAKEAISELLKK